MHPTDFFFKGAMRHLRLTTKQVNKGFYKGTRTGRMGRHTKKGGYIVDYRLVRTYVVPSLEDFRLTPFVSEKIPRSFGNYAGVPLGPKSPEKYLERWKAENGMD